MEKCDSIDAIVRRNEIMPRCNSLSQIFKNNDYSQNLAKKDAVKTFKRSRHITLYSSNYLLFRVHRLQGACLPWQTLPVTPLLTTIAKTCVQ